MDNTYLLQSRRTEYLKKFQKTTTPLFIEGVYSIYNNVKKNNKSKRLLLKEFQQAMVDVSRWSQDIIRNEHSRFKKQSSVLDRLIRAIFDLDIVIKKDLCKNAADFIPEPWDFVHQCYLNIARALWKQPFLVYDVNIDKLTVQQNKLRVEKIVSSCIQDTFTQYLPLDIEHDDISNVDYSVQQNNHSEEDVMEVGETNEASNTIEEEDRDDVGSRNVTVDSDVHEDFNVIQNDNQDNVNEEPQPFDNNDIDDFVNVDVNNDEQISVILSENDDNSDALDDSNDTNDNYDDNNLDESDDIETNEEDLVYIDDNGIESDNDDIRSVNDDVYDTKSFHSEEIGEVDSVKSEELYISRVDTQEENFHHNEDDHHKEEIKEIFIGKLNEYKQFSDETERKDERDLSLSSDVKVVHIDDNKARLTSRKDALLNIKKKVKSSMHHSREMENSKYERYGDKLRVERKNTSFF
jgi:hypothetical protein